MSVFLAVRPIYVTYFLISQSFCFFCFVSLPLHLPFLHPLNQFSFSLFLCFLSSLNFSNFLSFLPKWLFVFLYSFLNSFLSFLSVQSVLPVFISSFLCASTGPAAQRWLQAASAMSPLVSPLTSRGKLYLLLMPRMHKSEKSAKEDHYTKWISRFST